MRENQRGVDRLLAANNRLLVRDALAWEPSEQTDEANGIGTTTTTVLHENVLKLLPTLDALIFAVDSSEVGNDDGGGGPQGACTQGLNNFRARTKTPKDTKCKS